MSHTTVKSLNAEIKLLEARKKLVEKRDGEVPKAVAVLRKYAEVLTPAQRREVAKLIGGAMDGNSAVSPRAPQGPLKGRKLGKVAARYRLPSGETWTGRGLTPKVFTSWSKTAEGKAWSAANPSERFPAVDEAKAPARAVKKAKKVAKKAVQKPLAKKAPTKKAAKKVARKPARKPKAE